MSTSHQTTRRSFLQGIAATGAATVLSASTNRAFGYKSANDRPVFATIGLRNQAGALLRSHFNLLTLQHSPMSIRTSSG